MNIKNIILLFSALFGFSFTTQNNTSPNIIIIFTDDQGYADLSSFGSKSISTPNIDKLAENGIKFTDFHVAASVCSPSRAALLTGSYPNRVGIPAVLFPDGAWGTKGNTGLNPQEVTLAEILKGQGYSTAIAGKWHLGDEKMFLPLQHGFDEYFGIPYSNDMTRGSLPLIKGNEIIEIEPHQSQLTRRYTEYSIDFIKKHSKDTPFFLYLAHTMPHVPIYASEKFLGTSRGGLYGDVIEEIDWSVGEILKTLYKNEMLDNTLVIFTSDNGPWLSYGNHAGSSGNLRGGKFDVFEGGFRVPCVISWPAVIPEGKISHDLITTMDILPTICDITGAPLPENKIDGISILPFLNGKNMQQLDERIFYYYSNENLLAARKGPWKYIKSHTYGKVTDPGMNGKNGKTERAELPEALYNLEEDICESDNIIDKYPEIAKELKEKMKSFDSNLKKEARPIGVAEEEITQYLHVPSPKWQDQIIYFIVTDRFMDGYTSNNDQGEGEYKPGDGKYWNGGDLKGITQKINYIKELGATGIWITPPVANQWINPQKTGTGNHGYWARNFMKVDEHYGSLDDYKQLSASLHKNGMYLIQDVVVNHTGDFFTYSGPYDPNDVTKNFKLNDVRQPDQSPFNHNNALDPEDREMGIYHFTPTFQDHSDPVKRQTYQFADLDDLNTSNPVTREALRKTYNYWIREVGVDGFRFDTPMMVEHEFWNDFIHSDDSVVPGIEKTADSLGKKQFLSFGEAMVKTLPYDASANLEAAKFLGTKEKPEMTSVLNFPLFNTIQRVFQELRPTALMTFRLESLQDAFPQPELLLNFIDNHDGARFLTRARHSSFRQALMFIMTIPGIPVVYYGTEQEFLGTRQAMFKGGVGSPDHDHFITDNESFLFVKGLMDLRKANPVLTRGNLEVLRDSPSGPGIFVYQLDHENETCMVILNTSESKKLADKISTVLSPGTVLDSKYSLSGNNYSLALDAEGSFSIVLPPKEGLVLFSEGKTSQIDSEEDIITIFPPENDLITEIYTELKGTSRGLKNIHLTFDGNMNKSISAEIQEDGSWSANLPVHYLSNGVHRITAYGKKRDGDEKIHSDHTRIMIDLPLIRRGEYNDPVGDDRGPEGTYNYPGHPSYKSQMDITEVEVFSAGTNLEIEVEMNEITQIWLPPNEFDHVMINIYIDLPGKDGIDALPFQNADFPGDGEWDYLISTGGFFNAMFTSENASENQTGKATGPTPSINVNTETRKIKFSVSSEALGYPESLSGTKIYINTWDGGPGSLRALKPETEPWNFSGGTESDPKIMDDTQLIELD